MHRPFTCAECGGKFISEWTEEEARAESERDFPGLADEDATIVCDDCYNAMRAKAAEHGQPWAWTEWGWVTITLTLPKDPRE